LTRNIPIKFQLSDSTATLPTGLAAVTSLLVAPVNPDNSLGTPFIPASPGNTGLRLDGNTYVFSWQTKGLTAGRYAIVLNLADGTAQTKVITLSASNGSAGLLIDAAGGAGAGSTRGVVGGGITPFAGHNPPAPTPR